MCMNVQYFTLFYFYYVSFSFLLFLTHIRILFVSINCLGNILTLILCTVSVFHNFIHPDTTSLVDWA